MKNKQALMQLETLGLKKRHAQAYLALLTLGRGNPSEIAKAANIERTTIYAILEELAEKGLAQKVVTGKRIAYVAESPTVLHNLLQKQEQTLEQTLPLLLSLHKQTERKSTIQFYTTRDAIGRLVMESLNAREKVCRDFASVENVIDMFGITFVEHYIEKRVKRGITVRSLRHAPQKHSVEEPWYLRPDNQEVLREVRYLNPNVVFGSFIKTYDDKVIMISSPNDMFALRLENKEIADAMKILFDIAWETSQKAPTADTRQ